MVYMRSGNRGGQNTTININSGYDTNYDIFATRWDATGSTKIVFCQRVIASKASIAIFYGRLLLIYREGVGDGDPFELDKAGGKSAPYDGITLSFFSMICTSAQSVNRRQLQISSNAGSY